MRGVDVGSDLRKHADERVEFTGHPCENWDTSKDGPDAELVPPAGPTDQHLRRVIGVASMPPTLFPQATPDPSQPVTDLVAGVAAEHIVCADLLLDGWRAFLTDQYCPYDLAVEVDGRLLRVQVKATRTSKPIPQRTAQIPAYQWHIRRAGKGGARVYGAGEFDMLALVALDIRRIAYLPPSLKLQTVHIRPPGAPGGRQFDDFPFTRAIEGVAA